MGKIGRKLETIDRRKVHRATVSQENYEIKIRFLKTRFSTSAVSN